jgi:long-chain acyl-CoA synthetase
MLNKFSKHNKIWIKYYNNGNLQEILTFKDFNKRVKERIFYFEEKGVSKGDRVIVMMSNSPEVIVIYFVLLRMGAISVPLSPKEPNEKINYVINHSCANFIIKENGEIKEIEHQNNNLKYSYKEIKKVTTIIYTSGTTGNPKGVCLSWGNWKANAKSLMRHHNLNQDTVIASPLPLFHCNAHGLSMYSTYLAGSTLILFNKASDNFLDIIKKEQVNILSIVPAILYTLYHRVPFWTPPYSLRYILTAAAPLDGSLLKKVLKNWQVKVIQGFGLSESTNFSCTIPTNISEKKYNKIMFPVPSIGISLKGVKIKLQQEGGDNSRGEVNINSKSNFLGYWGEKLKRRKWVESGDVAYSLKFGRRNYYYLVGRHKEFINRGGEKLAPLALEREIKEAGVDLNFVVVPIKDEKHGEEVAIVTLSEFDFSLLNKIPLYRRPKKVFQTDNIITTSTGKIKRRKIAEMCQKGSYPVIWK